MNTFLSCFDSAFKRAKDLLWPFRTKVWLKLLVVYLLAGSCTGFPGTGSSSDEKDKESIKPEITQTQESQEEQPQPDQAPIEESKNQKFDQFLKEGKEKILTLWEENRPLVFTFAGILGFFIVLLFLLLIWVQSRFDMILLKSLIQKEIHIRQYWSSTKKWANSLFRFKLVVLLSVFLPLILIGFGTIGPLLGKGAESVDVLFVIVGILLIIFGLFVWFAGFWFAHTFLPIVVYSRDVSAYEGFKMILRFAKNNIKKAFIYSFMYMIFSTAIYIGFSMAFLFLGLLIGLPTILISAIVGSLIASLGSIVKGAVIFVGVVLGFGLILILLLVQVIPVQTFLGYFRLELVGKEMGELKNPLT